MNPYLNSKSYTLHNAEAILSSIRNMYYSGEPHIMEQAAHRMALCLQDNSSCIKKVVNANGEQTYVFGHCDSCGCAAPYLFYATNKTCRYRNSGEIKWSNMMSEQAWEEFKKIEEIEIPEFLLDINHKTNEQSNDNVRHTDSEPESPNSVESSSTNNATDTRGVSSGKQAPVLLSTNISSEVGDIQSAGSGEDKNNKNLRRYRFRKSVR